MTTPLSQTEGERRMSIATLKLARSLNIECFITTRSNRNQYRARLAEIDTELATLGVQIDAWELEVRNRRALHG